ncbi:MAG: AP2 domain-containing protein [Sedimentisphaerales bacterium]|jgi:hypothetical protein
MKVNLTIGIPDWLDRICVWPVMWYRRRKYGYDYRRIYLGEGEWTIVEQEDYYRLGNLKWCISGNGSKFYVARNVKAGPGKTRVVLLHREIMNAPRGIVVDHQNRNTLDNRKANLRLVTQSQNQYYKVKTKSKTTSRFIGVYFEKRTGRWAAKIKYRGNGKWLGRFDNEIAAAKAYDEAAKKYHGEFARLNFGETACSV